MWALCFFKGGIFVYRYHSESELALLCGYVNSRIVGQLARQDHLGQLGNDMLLKITPQWSGSEQRVIGALQDQVQSLSIDLQVDVPLLQSLAKQFDLLRDYVMQMMPTEGMENYDVV